MKRASLIALCLIVLGAPFAAHADPPAARQFDGARVAAVTAAALAFIPSHALFETSAPQLAMWGMRGLSALDQRLVVRLDGEPGSGRVTMSFEGLALAAFAAPDPTDTTGWGRTIAALTQRAWVQSPRIRDARTGGILASIFDEMFAHFDPYTRYVPPRPADRERVERGTRAGPGLDIADHKGAFVVVRLDPQGPAAEAGIRLGDVLLSVDDSSVQGADVADVHAMLAGPRGSTVVLTVRSPGQDIARTLIVERSSAAPATVFTRREGKFLVVRIQAFASDTGARLSQDLIRAMASHDPPRGIVIDLRDNRGGVLASAVDAASALLGHGVVAFTEGRDPEARRILRAKGRDLARGLPVVALVDGNTASAAEVFAAALADDRRAVVIGTATLGKGLVQAVEPMPDGGELFLTWSRILAPRGWPLQDLGVMPQICTSLGPGAVARQLRALGRGTDPMLDAAMAARAARPPLSPLRALALRAPCPAALGHGGEVAAATSLLGDIAAYQSALLPPTTAARHP